MILTGEPKIGTVSSLSGFKRGAATWRRIMRLIAIMMVSLVAAPRVQLDSCACSGPRLDLEVEAYETYSSRGGGLPSPRLWVKPI
jgi:hypothetical protein